MITSFIRVIDGPLGWDTLKNGRKKKGLNMWYFMKWKKYSFLETCEEFLNRPASTTRSLQTYSVVFSTDKQGSIETEWTQGIWNCGDKYQSTEVLLGG